MVHVARLCAAEARRIEADGVGMVGIHMVDSLSLHGGKIRNLVGMQKHVARAHAIGAPKATVQAGGRNLQAPECEIRKIDVERSFRVMRQ